MELFNFQYELLIDFFKNAIKLEPDNPTHYNSLSMVYATKEIDKAITYSEKALELAPNNQDLLSNLALNYKTNSQFNEAIECFNKALTVKEIPEILTNLGSVYLEKNDLKNATKSLKRALKLNPKLNGAKINLAYCCHLNKQYKQGWRYYEYRLKHFEQLRQYLSIFGKDKLWNGKDSLKDKTVLIFAEQGYGDLVQFARYIPFLKEKECKIILLCDNKIASLAKLFNGVDEIELKDNYSDIKHFDYHVPIMSLPCLLKMYTPFAIDNVLKLDEKTAVSDTNKFKVGIAWKGNSKHAQDKKRSCDVEYFLKLKNPKIQLINLTTEKLNDPDVLDVIDENDDFLKTAKIINGLDCVISVDTCVLHLAGTLGVTTIGLLAYKPDFRWGLDDKNTLWYKNVFLLRQKEINNWNLTFNFLDFYIRCLTGCWQNLQHHLDIYS
jgi:tetratricopeptide (TPR) repeat protein